MAMDKELKHILTGIGIGTVTGGTLGGLVSKKGHRGKGVLYGSLVGMTAGGAFASGLGLALVMSNKPVNKVTPGMNAAL